MSNPHQNPQSVALRARREFMGVEGVLKVSLVEGRLRLYVSSEEMEYKLPLEFLGIPVDTMVVREGSVP